jgi:hypothetical protein
MKAIILTAILASSTIAFANETGKAAQPTTKPAATAPGTATAADATAKKMTAEEAKKACTTEGAKDMAKCVTDKMSAHATH